ncbi:beta-Ala-His dipeptidase [Sarocladium strictum]
MLASSSTHSISSPVLSPIDRPERPAEQPELVHSLEHGSTILALIVSDHHGCIFAGTQDGEIVAWSLATFQQVHKVQAHKRSVLSLFLSPDASLLFSSAGDPIISVWFPKTLHRIYEIYSTHDVGDIFCTAYSAQHDTLYIGAQNATIQWVALNDQSVKAPPGSQKHPDKRNHRFFDSKAVGGSSTPRRNDDKWALIPKALNVLEVNEEALRNFAHHGYVYCMLMAKGPTVEVNAEDDVLISGGGDGTIKLWNLRPTTGENAVETQDHIEEIMTLGEDDAESVLSLAIDGSFLYAGKLDGVVELWDLDTAQKLRVIRAHDKDIESLQMGWGYLWVASSDGWVSKYSTTHYGKYKHSALAGANAGSQCLLKWQAHQGKILASAVTTYKNEQYYITGANDDDISIWSMSDCARPKSSSAQDTEDVLLSALKDFVAYKTVSSRPEFAEDCRKGATFLGSLFKRLGGHVEMLSTNTSHNPVVYARFSGKKDVAASGAEKRKRILFYGHYDVVAADNKKGTWSSDPFNVKGANGFLYGRGVTDNKGPILAALYAVTDLIRAQRLENDVIFLIEGEEEFGSRGFKDAVRSNKKLIGDVDYILLANSYWLDDETPCLTYGLRGVLHATVTVDSARPDTHSGVDGAHLMNEPLSDLTMVLAKLKGPGNRVQIPGFYDGIPAVTPGEEARYDAIASSILRRRDSSQPSSSPSQLKQSLMARWREPNLTIHRYRVSGPEGSLISSEASAHISFRLVPGQEVGEVARELEEFLASGFATLDSQNHLSVRIDNVAEPWIGDPGNDIFRTLEGAVVEAWSDSFDTSDEEDADKPDGDVKGSGKPRHPLYIREGGSIPAIRFLEKEFAAPAAHLPCGQASDAAHLDNERIRMVNLFKAREIFGKVFERL